MSSSKTISYSTPQLTVLVALRLCIGWHFLYEGLLKVFNPNWSSMGYLIDSQGCLKGMFQSIAANPDLLKAVDFLNVWGLVLIGLGLILGCFTRIACLGGVAILALYYCSHPPLLGVQFMAPVEGSYLWVDKNLIEAVALLCLFFFPTGHIIGFDRLICKLTGKCCKCHGRK